MLNIGTRRSPLALAQTHIVQRLLATHFPEKAVSVTEIVTEGDRNTVSSLKEMGGKNVFVRDIDHALLDRKINLAVHSLKDITSSIPKGLILAGCLAPESVHDVLVLRRGQSLNDLPKGARIGTGSSRRKALLAARRFDMVPVGIRGNVETRISKVDSGDVDGVMLSEVGLIRLGLTDRLSYRFDATSFYPAPGQGVIALVCREEDEATREVCRRIRDEQSTFVSRLSMSFQHILELGCNDPLGMHVVLNGEVITASVFLGESDGPRFIDDTLVSSRATVMDDLHGFSQRFREWKQQL